MSYTPENERFENLFEDLINKFDSIDCICKNRIRGEDWTKEHKLDCFELRNRIQEFESWLREKGFM